MAAADRIDILAVREAGIAVFPDQQDITATQGSAERHHDLRPHPDIIRQMRGDIIIESFVQR